MSEELARSIRLVSAGAKPRKEKLKGRDHYVVPVIALLEGVIHAVNADDPEFVPGEVLTAAAHTWNGRPLMLGHPTKDGRQISANSPEILIKGCGTIFNSKAVGKKLGMEAWFDIDRLKELEQKVLLDAIEAGKPVEVSVGAFVRTEIRNGEYKGKKYKGVWKTATGDHLAVLVGGKGACSVEMGCGLCRAAEVYTVQDEELYALTRQEYRRLGGRGSGNFGHSGRKGKAGGSGPGKGVESSAETLKAWTDAGHTLDDAWDLARDALDIEGATVFKNEVYVETTANIDTPHGTYEATIVVKAPYEKPSKADASYSPTDQLYDAIEAGQATIKMLSATELRELGGKGSGWTKQAGHVPGSQGGVPGSAARVAAHTKGSASHLNAAVEIDNSARALQRNPGQLVVITKEALSLSNKAMKDTKASGAQNYAASAANTYVKMASKADHSDTAVKHLNEAAKFHRSASEWHLKTGKLLNEVAQARQKPRQLSMRRLAAEDMALDEKVNKVNAAVSKQYSTGSTASIGPNGDYAYAQMVFDDHVIIRKGDGKLYQCNYTMSSDGNVTFIDPMTEVKVAYIAAEDDTCEACDGTGKVGGKSCPICSEDEESESEPVAAAADEPQPRAACRCEEGVSTMDKTKKAELIAALVTDKHSGYEAGDEPILETMSDARLEKIRTAAAARTEAVAKAEKDENDLRAASAKVGVLETKLLKALEKPTTEQWLANAPAEIKAVFESHKAAEEEKRTDLVAQIKAAQDVYTEDELKALSTPELDRLAKVLKIDEPVADYSGRGMPRAAAATDKTDVYANPPDAYAEALKKRQASAA